ncbi:hypothetical protein GOP47_0010927 [Adiantum capillus-veneris]|uniref:Uncharacterized protein n=1 Tax=Adiantum capillus-veneris TaxID=13818 RepID=A0A9D4ZJ70_ADICA|nr:hypothetical protein GOP47_0010927 [Adiantum capillus-veneris]
MGRQDPDRDQEGLPFCEGRGCSKGWLPVGTAGRATGQRQGRPSGSTEKQEWELSVRGGGVVHVTEEHQGWSRGLPGIGVAEAKRRRGGDHGAEVGGLQRGNTEVKGPLGGV